MITKRDEEILKFINFFGKTYTKVLEKTFFQALVQQKIELQILKNKT